MGLHGLPQRAWTSPSHTLSSDSTAPSAPTLGTGSHGQDEVYQSVRKIHGGGGHAGHKSGDYPGTFLALLRLYRLPVGFRGGRVSREEGVGCNVTVDPCCGLRKVCMAFDASSVTASSATNLFQTNSVAILAERSAAIKPLATNAYAHLTGVAFGLSDSPSGI